MSSESSLLPNGLETIFYVGQHDTQETEPATGDSTSQSQTLGYDFLTSTITTSAFHSRVLEQVEGHLQEISQVVDDGDFPLPSISPLGPDDTNLEPYSSNSAVIGVVSPWIDLASTDPVIAHISRQVLNIEVAYAAFCGINNVIIYGPTSSVHVVQFARAVREALGLGPYINLHTLLPMTGELELDHGILTHLSEIAREAYIDQTDDHVDEEDLYRTWDAWDQIRTMCSYSQKLSIALELPRQLFSNNIQSRWFSEPVRLLVFPRTTFLRNAKNYPVLSKPHQQLISRFSRLRPAPWMLLCDVGSNNLHSQTLDPTPSEAAASKAKEKPKDPIPHLRYFRHLQQNQPPIPPIEMFGNGYQDYLQSPLQPLTDNLESITYEVFEKDPVKYEWYERAIAAALTDLVERAEDSKPIVVAVVGAGRGPLVTRTLQASVKTGVAVECWAVEKNPNAFVLLQRKNATDALWNSRVNVVKSDMRHWNGPTTTSTSTSASSTANNNKVDILVSELLGSFGDNELSPECLDGIQHVLHPNHGISIPQSYSAHFTPIATPRLHSDLLGRPGTEKWDVPYVVMLHQYDYLCAQNDAEGVRRPDVREAWSFSHPLSAAILEQSRRRAGVGSDAGGWAGGDGGNEHNARSCHVTFHAAEPGVCHGLAGYFETVLYAGKSSTIELSTNPLTMEKSKDMISWFPIFFPLKTPLHVAENSDVEVSMWRQTDDRSVWYEWIVEVYDKTANERRKRLAMSELHSSRKHGCLM